MAPRLFQVSTHNAGKPYLTEDCFHYKSRIAELKWFLGANTDFTTLITAMGVWRQGLSNANFTRRGRPDYGHYWRPGLPGAGLSPQDDLSPGWQAWWQVDYIRPLPSGTGQCCVLTRCKLLYRGWMNNTVLLYSMGDHIHYPVMNIMENRIF